MLNDLFKIEYVQVEFYLILSVQVLNSTQTLFLKHFQTPQCGTKVLYKEI